MRIKESIKRYKLFWITSGILGLILTIFNVNLIQNLLKLKFTNGTTEYILVIVGVIFLILLNLGSIFIPFRFLIKEKNKQILITTIVISILTVILSFISYYFTNVINLVDNVNKDYVTYTSSLVVMKKNSTWKIKDFNNKKIGMLKDTNNYEGYIIPKEMIKENKIENNIYSEYDNNFLMLKDLYDDKLDAIFLPGNYASMYDNLIGYEHIHDETKVIISKSMKYKKIKNVSNKKIDSPFTLLILGVDDVRDDISSTTSFNGDSITLITFNPKTANTTFLTIPRDTYVPIACFENQKENKITHAAWGGEECVIQTIQNLTGIEIDYYMKVNFKAIVNIVDNLGGITVDVPYNMCEQDSKRRWDKYTVFLEKGIKKINGEQALALARHRQETSYMASYCGKKYIGNDVSDLVRGQNQQIIIQAIMEKIKDVKNINTIYNLMKVIEKNIDTNISLNQIISLYEMGKEILNENEKLNIQRLYLSGYDAAIYDDTFGVALYDYIYYSGSLDDIVKAMKINLGLLNEAMPTSDENGIIGKCCYTATYYIDTVPDFIGKDKAYIEEWANKKGFTVIYEEIESDKPVGEIISQSIPYGFLLSKIDNKAIKISISSSSSQTIYSDCSLEENSNNDECQIPNFTGKNISEFNTWYANLSKYNINIEAPEITEIMSDNPEYDDSRLNIITEIIFDSTLLKSVSKIEIKYIKGTD